MNGRNGFFQLLINEDGIYIKIYSAEPGGQPILYDEIANYLNERKIIDYDKIQISNALKSTEEICEVKLSSEQIIHTQDESLKLVIPENADYAIGRFYAPSNRGRLLTKEDIVYLLNRNGVKYGIDEQAVKQFLEDRKYCTDYVLAKGTPAISGYDAEITYHFNTDLTLKPKMNEDGTVDFHQLDMISHCKKGELLATLVPADYGKQGMDVLGRAILPPKVNNKVLKHGKKIHLSEDGLQMYSDVDGHVSLVDNRVFVNDTFEIPANVDSSTGDIEYEGNVIVKGNVITGFSIRAKGDIEVYGAVEGAYLEADGQIVLRRGIQGMYKGILKAKRNIIAKFIENAQVIAGGYISTETILHSKITAQEEIIVAGKKGLVTGGVIRSRTFISVKTAGSAMGTATQLEVGIDPVVSEELRESEKQLLEMSDQREKLNQILVMYRKKLTMGVKLDMQNRNYIEQLIRSFEVLDQQIKEKKERYDNLLKAAERDTTGKIEVHDIIYSGSKLIISNINFPIRNNIHHSKFIRDGADIKVVPL